MNISVVVLDFHCFREIIQSTKSSLDWLVGRSASEKKTLHNKNIRIHCNNLLMQGLQRHRTEDAASPSKANGVKHKCEMAAFTTMHDTDIQRDMASHRFVE
jgi:hypothetical protein